MAAPLLAAARVECEFDEEPPFFYRRLGEVSFGAPAGAGNGARGQSVATSSAAGLVAWS